MQLNNEETVESLLSTARDESKPAEERYAALRHVCQLRGDVYQHVPLEQLRPVAAGMGDFFGLTHLSLRDSAEAVAAGIARRAAPNRHK